MKDEEVHDDRTGCDWVHRDSDTRIERGRFNRHRVGIAGRFLRIPGLLLVWLLSVRRRLLSACYLLQQRVRALLLVARP